MGKHTKSVEKNHFKQGMCPFCEGLEYKYGRPCGACNGTGIAKLRKHNSIKQ